MTADRQSAESMYWEAARLPVQPMYWEAQRQRSTAAPDGDSYDVPWHALFADPSAVIEAIDAPR